MNYIEGQPETTSDAALISRLSLWIGQFDPIGKRFQTFEREKCGHNAELMAVLTSPICSRNLLHAYSEALTRADQMGYFPFNIDQESGLELTEHDYIRQEDRERDVDVPTR